jgi:hypothetical protein
MSVLGGKADLADDWESIITIGSVDSGLAASRRPGMTFLANSSVARRFWHIETNKGLKLIDELRAEIRSGMAAG